MRSPHLPAQVGQLYDVSCPDRDWCMAVGFSEVPRQGGPGYVILTEAWDGTAWSVLPGPRLGIGGFKYLNSVSCVSRDWCMAVGQYYPGQASNLAELWNGRAWSYVRTPDVSGVDQLNSVSCVTMSFCMAAGYGVGTLTETWNGSAWSVIRSPDVGHPPLDQATGVSCPSPGFCMLLDLFDNGAKQDMATFSWNGTSWSALPTPNPGPGTNVLDRVDCASAVSCTAVGTEVLGQSAVALIEHWNGASWSVTPTPAESSADLLAGISCTGIEWCAAVGDRVAAGGPRTVRTLAEVSDGGTWMFSRTGSPSTSYAVLSGISCGGSNTGGVYCVAVGYRSPETGGLTPLIESYRAPLAMLGPQRLAWPHLRGRVLL